MGSLSYRNAFYAALGLHGFLALLFMIESAVSTPVMVNASRQASHASQPTQLTAQAPQKTVNAVSVDAHAVAETVKRLKQARELSVRQEQQRQQALQKQASDLRRAREQEQQRLTQLKEETDKLAILKKKQQVEEVQRARQMALQKEKEIQQLARLKKQQQELETRQKKAAEALAALKMQEKKQHEQRAEAKASEQKRAAQQAQAIADAQKQRAAQEASLQQARREAAESAQMAGEVDKYKAMILNAISQKWILPDHVNQGISSQFRIRLAPDGAVLEVSLLRSSGDPVLDRSAQNAIYRASPLPVPGDPHTFNVFRDIHLTVRPDQVRG